MKTYRLNSPALASILFTAAVVAAAENDGPTKPLARSPCPAGVRAGPVDCATGRCRPTAAFVPQGILARDEASQGRAPYRRPRRLRSETQWPPPRRDRHQPAVVAIRAHPLLPRVRRDPPPASRRQLPRRHAINSFWDNPRRRAAISSSARNARRTSRCCSGRVDAARSRRQRPAPRHGQLVADAAGPVTFSHIFAGEDFDARLVQPDWDRPVSTTHWTPARAAQAPRGFWFRKPGRPSCPAKNSHRSKSRNPRRASGCTVPPELRRATARQTGRRQVRRPNQLPLRRAQEPAGPPVRRLQRRLRTRHRWPAARTSG